MKLSRTWSVNPVWFSLVPLFNVTFLLICFFALSSSFMLQPGVAVTLPPSSFMLPPQQEPLIVSITSGPAPAIYFQDERVTLDEFEERIAALKTRERPLVVRADRDAPYSMVVEVMNRGLHAGFPVALAANLSPQ